LHIIDGKKKNFGEFTGNSQHNLLANEWAMYFRMNVGLLQRNAKKILNNGYES